MPDAVDTAPATTTGVSGLIDVHTHFPAEAQRRALERAGAVDDSCGLAVWDAEHTLDVLGNVGIEFSVLSPGPPLPVFTAADEACRTAREFNEELADQIADDPTTYGGVAYLPLPYVGAALEELAYALDVLKLDGVHLLTSYRGRYPGDPVFTPLLEELDRRGATVMTHPTRPPAGVPDFAGCSLSRSLELMFDTTRLTANLLVNGVLQRYPGITWILAHGGATILQTSHLLRDQVRAAQELSESGAPARSDRGDDLMQGLHLDVVWNVAEPMLSRLADLQGPDKLLFGTNMPNEYEPRVAQGITTLMSNDSVDEGVKRAIARDNALRIFPSVARKLRRRAGLTPLPPE